MAEMDWSERRINEVGETVGGAEDEARGGGESVSAGAAVWVGEAEVGSRYQAEVESHITALSPAVWAGLKE